MTDRKAWFNHANPAPEHGPVGCGEESPRSRRALETAPTVRSAAVPGRINPMTDLGPVSITQIGPPELEISAGFSALILLTPVHLPGASPQAGIDRAFGPIITVMLRMFLRQHGLKCDEALCVGLIFEAQFEFTPGRWPEHTPKRQRRGLIPAWGE